MKAKAGGLCKTSQIFEKLQKSMQLVISHFILLSENLCVSLVGALYGLEKFLCNSKNISQDIRLKSKCVSALNDQQTLPGQRRSTAFATTPEGRTKGKATGWK